MKRLAYLLWTLGSRSDRRPVAAKARTMLGLEALERRETPNSLANPLLPSALASLDAAPDVSYSIVPAAGATPGPSVDATSDAPQADMG